MSAAGKGYNRKNYGSAHVGGFIFGRRLAAVELLYVADAVHCFASCIVGLRKHQDSSIQAAIADLQHIYQSTIFPYMKVDWRTHPNNIEHLYSPGCFRCHDGQHISANGRVIPKSCETCHTVLAEVQSGVPLIGREQGVPFQHPVDIGDLTQVTCSDCHTGGFGP